MYQTEYLNGNCNINFTSPFNTDLHGGFAKFEFSAAEMLTVNYRKCSFTERVVINKRDIVIFSQIK